MLLTHEFGLEYIEEHYGKIIELEEHVKYRLDVFGGCIFQKNRFFFVNIFRSYENSLKLIKEEGASNRNLHKKQLYLYENTNI